MTDLTLPPGLREKYGRRFACGINSATGAIDIMIPPSISMILYGAAAEQSVARLFIAGVLPGLLLALLNGCYVVWYARRNDIRDTESVGWRTFLTATRKGFWSLGGPAVILGGIYGGVFAPTEAAGGGGRRVVVPAHPLRGAAAGGLALRTAGAGRVLERSAQRAVVR